MKNLFKPSLLILLVLVVAPTFSQDGTIYLLDTPKEPNAIVLGTGE